MEERFSFSSPVTAAVCLGGCGGGGVLDAARCRHKGGLLVNTHTRGLVALLLTSPSLRPSDALTEEPLWK